MKREIDAGIALAGHPHAMPILDHAADHTWFVMPWAEDTAHDHRESLQDPQQVRDLVDALTSVLAEAHRLGWIHRDIKPANILRLNGQWVLADWGSVRRPAGQTTKVGRTSAGIGTEGFTAPELFQDQDQDQELRPQPSSDIYSVGRMIAWALTGQVPRTNMPLLPEQPGPWRNIVRAATQTDPKSRPQTISALLTLIEREHAEVPEDPGDLVDRATKLVAAANRGEPAAGDAFLTLLTDHGHDYELHVGVLTRLAVKRAGQALARDQARAQSILRVLAEHVDGDGTRVVQFAEAATVVIWLQGLAAYAGGRRDWDLLEEAVQTMCIWDGAWNQWRAQDKVGPWLASLKGDAATAVAAVLRDHPDSARHFSGLADNPAVDPRIRQAVRNA
ncbi:protein kinase domain-containing protein [Streptomyces sp. NPDC055709]